METYELHVCRNGDWRKLKSFEARQAAMSASIELERARRFSAVKIFKLALDPEVKRAAIYLERKASVELV